MRRRSGCYDQGEPDIISPRAARLNEGVHSGPRTQGHGPASGGAVFSGVAGPRSRQPNHAGAASRNDDFEDMYENLKAKAFRRPHAGGRSHHDAEEEAGFADARPSARRHDNVSEHLNRRAERDDGFGQSGAFSDSSDPAK